MGPDPPFSTLQIYWGEARFTQLAHAKVSGPVHRSERLPTSANAGVVNSEQTGFKYAF
jgi:hypothetical protein